VFVQLTRSLRRVVLPAFPFLDADRLASECLGMQDTGPIPYALVGAIIAHCSIFFPAIRPLARQLWVLAMSPLAEAYLIPRLRTLQCAVCVLISRPAENAGQSDNVLSTVSRGLCLKSADGIGRGNGAHARTTYRLDELEYTGMGAIDAEETVVVSAYTRQMASAVVWPAQQVSCPLTRKSG
jgi:hypothetical protein